MLDIQLVYHILFLQIYQFKMFITDFTASLIALTKPNYMGHIWTNYGIDMVQPMGHIWKLYGFGMAWFPS